MGLTCLILLLACSAGTGAGDGHLILSSFDQEAELARWYPVNDTVMGGLSQSRLSATEDGTALFEGLLSLEEWLTVCLPLSRFAPSFRGRPVPEAGPLDPARVRAYGLMLADGQEGPFRLEIDAITAYRAGGCP